MTSDTRVLTSAELYQRAGVTYRQVDYWTRMGHLVPLVAAHGSGSQREWAENEVAVARLLAHTGPPGAQYSEDKALAVEKLLMDVRLGQRGVVVFVPGCFLDLDYICGEIPDEEAVAV